jgi:hypothetical protein
MYSELEVRGTTSVLEMMFAGWIAGPPPGVWTNARLQTGNLTPHFLQTPFLAPRPCNLFSRSDVTTQQRGAVHIL